MMIIIPVFVESDEDKLLAELGIDSLEVSDVMLNVGDIVYTLDGDEGTIIYLRSGIPEEDRSFVSIVTPLRSKELYSKIVSAGMTQN